MLCEELYKLGEKYLSKEGQRLVEKLVSEGQTLSAQAVLAGGVLAKMNQMDPEDRPLVEKLLLNFCFSLEGLT